MPDRILILDTTLRVQPAVGVDFSLRDKIDIAVELARAGVDVIEAGRPAVSVLEREAVRRVAEQVRSVRIGALARCVPQEVQSSPSV